MKKYCPKCGNEVRNTAAYCGQCGYQLINNVKSVKDVQAARKKKIWMILCIIFIIAVIVVSFSVLKLNNKATQNPSLNSSINTLSSEEQLKIAKNIVMAYSLSAEDLLSSGGVASVVWMVVDEGYVTATRDSITFRFIVNSDGSAYFDGAEQVYGDEVSPEALSLVFEQYYEIGRLRGTLY